MTTPDSGIIKSRIVGAIRQQAERKKSAKRQTDFPEDPERNLSSDDPRE